ncbi:rod shape-determining protein MreD [Desulfothermobacter acidiphilus]|uniref:rod shape-determining protein MreD n=1 Tax=Desulfothermobacter acidiphilus TaxID=1938353 RepID=UPI003F8A95C9
MRTLILILLAIISLLLQTTALTYLRVAGVRPDLLLILAIFIGFWWGPREGGVWGGALGLLMDLLTGGMVGFNLLTKLLAGYLAGEAGIYFYQESSLACAIITGSITLMVESIAYLLLLLLGIRLPWMLSFLFLILPLAAYNTLAALILFYPWQKLLPRRLRAR